MKLKGKIIIIVTICLAIFATSIYVFRNQSFFDVIPVKEDNLVSILVLSSQATGKEYSQVYWARDRDSAKAFFEFLSSINIHFAKWNFASNVTSYVPKGVVYKFVIDCGESSDEDNNEVQFTYTDGHIYYKNYK